MTGSTLPFDTSRYEKRRASSLIYEPVFNAEGSLVDFRVVYVSDALAELWHAECRCPDCLGTLLRGSGLLDEYSLRMMEQSYTGTPRCFVSYLPSVELRLFFEPIDGLSPPYSGFYLTEISDDASFSTKEHFLHNVRLMGNNAVLFRTLREGQYEAEYVSGEFAEMMECSVEQAKQLLQGTGFYKITDPEDRPLLRSMLRHRINYKGGNTLTLRKTTAKRRHIWCNVHFAFIDDFNGQYIYCTYTDVTALKEYEERLRSVYSAMGNSFYQVSDKTLGMFRINLTRDSIEEVKGRELYRTDTSSLSYTESMRRRAHNYPIPAERTLFLQQFDRERLIASYLTGSTSVSQVIYSIRQDGRSCFVSFSAAVTRHPLTGDMMAFITERECNSEKVRETLTSKILAQQFDMVAYLVDGEYGVTIGDEARIKRGSIFPTTRSGKYRQYLEHQVYPVLIGTKEEREDAMRALDPETVARALAVSDPYVVNIGIEMDGETYYKRFDFYSIDPNAKFYILLKSDTTEIQKEQIARNQQLREALEAANQANVAKTAFLSSMSHEIRTPMNAIIGLDSIALKDPDISQRTREQLEKIGGSARHLLNLINDILDMSRIESGRMTLRSEEFSFSEMLEQINTMINSQCQDRGLTYECHVLGHVDDYYIGDNMKLKQVIINILGNAVKFTPAPGRVSCTVERTAEFEGQSTLRFVMSDTGIGMDKSYLPHIFEAFSQENDSRTSKFGSTGLGMAITKNIVELMNGNISVESERGVGSTFTVNVTLRNSERSAQQVRDVSAQDLKVMVIDDDPVACEHAQIILSELGISADTCLSGREALDTIQLKAARREAYNLIFVDWKMPEQDGIAVTREIRRIAGSESAVIVLTAYHWDEIEEEARLAGVDGFMAKPLFAANVLSAFQQAMSSRQSVQEEQESADLAGRRVLLAEDMMINAEIMMDLLDMVDVKADHAENGQRAVELFAQSEQDYYDAVLMDVRMPVLDGLGATAAIRALNRPDAKTVPIIAMTANAFDEDVQRSMQAGMNAHLTKPVDPDRLYETLGALIRP